MKVKTSQLQKLIKQELPQESSTANFSWINAVAINILPREISPFKVNDKKLLEFFAAYACCSLTGFNAKNDRGDCACSSD